MLKLESFDGTAMALDDATLTARDAESLRSTSFEEGYGAGWSDALEQMRHEDALRRAAAQEALQAIAFSFHEACEALESNFMSLATEMVTTLLPELVPEARRRLLAAELRALAARQFAGRLELLCAPGTAAGLADLADSVPGLEIAMVEEPSFTDSQLMIRVDQNTRQIDLHGLMATLQAALTDIPNQKDSAHG